MTSIEYFRRNIIQLLDSEEHMRLMYKKTKSGFDLWMYGHISIEFIPPGNYREPQFQVCSYGDSYNGNTGGDRIYFTIYPEIQIIEVSHNTYTSFGEEEDGAFEIAISCDDCTEEWFFQLSLIEDLRGIEYTDIELVLRLFKYLQDQLHERNKI